MKGQTTRKGGNSETYPIYTRRYNATQIGWLYWTAILRFILQMLTLRKYIHKLTLVCNVKQYKVIRKARFYNLNKTLY